jgi:murein DD-endopeptidase MepM/ murein hydrolase activator NlpD
MHASPFATPWRLTIRVHDSVFREIITVNGESMLELLRTHRFLAILPGCCLAVLLVFAGLRSFQQEPTVAIASQPPPEAVAALEMPSFLWDPAPLQEQFSRSFHKPASGGNEWLPLKELNGKLQAGDSLIVLLTRLGVAKEIRQQIISGFECCFDIKRLRAGDAVSLTMAPDGSLISITLRHGTSEKFTLFETSSGWTVVEDRIPVVGHTVKVSGAIGPLLSLTDAFAKAGEKTELAHAFARIFLLLTDLENGLTEGDRFNLLVEKYYRDDQFIGYGRILMGRFEKAGEGELHEALYFQAGQAEGGYFNRRGRNLDSLYLVQPVSGARITSSFSSQREHPILRRILPHLGIDLAAPEGTPVLAAADGILSFIGRNGGFGNQIVIKHAGGFRTYYGHLSGYAAGLEVGSTVNQADIIGYVGSTGLSTGPHLDYRLEHHGKFKNPLAAEHKISRDLVSSDLFRMQLSADIYSLLMESDAAHKTISVRELNIAADTLPLLPKIL